MSRRRSAGFTLLELVVALAVTALALAGLSGAVRDAARLDHMLTDRSRGADEAEGLFALLETLLSDVQQGLSGEALQRAAYGQGVTISGTDREISIRSRGPLVLGLTVPAPFTVAFQSEPSAADQGKVILRWSPATKASESEVAVNAVRAFELRYAHVDRGQGIVWTHEWRLPAEGLSLIEASIVDGPSGRRRTAIFPITLRLPRICVLEPLLDGCPRWN